MFRFFTLNLIGSSIIKLQKDGIPLSLSRVELVNMELFELLGSS